ncbi:unnamed protein product [Microthlaspi erraticum]|uniref:F-box domain-containing protein n=1 Tax=Microthlaspi erraticum TaxID=1685480 RepID=A0A6D2L9C5_9BRAS|nr:unnamed protein product [Microthlaspi erraticum]
MSISVTANETPQPRAKRSKRLKPSSLPIEMALNCLARVSKSEHASLSLVSKWHRRQLISPELYEFRSLLGFTENVIYLCLQIPPEPNPRWFALFPKTQNRPRRLVQVRSTLYQPPDASSVVAHGCGIYVIGGRRISGIVSPSGKRLSPGLPIAQVDHSPFHESPSRVCRGGSGRREDIRSGREQGLGESRQLGRGFRPKDADLGCIARPRVAG